MKADFQLGIQPKSLYSIRLKHDFKTAELCTFIQRDYEVARLSSNQCHLTRPFNMASYLKWVCNLPKIALGYGHTNQVAKLTIPIFEFILLKSQG